MPETWQNNFQASATPGKFSSGKLWLWNVRLRPNRLTFPTQPDRPCRSNQPTQLIWLVGDSIQLHQSYEGFKSIQMKNRVHRNEKQSAKSIESTTWAEIIDFIDLTLSIASDESVARVNATRLNPWIHRFERLHQVSRIWMTWRNRPTQSKTPIWSSYW